MKYGVKLFACGRLVLTIKCETAADAERVALKNANCTAYRFLINENGLAKAVKNF